MASSNSVVLDDFEDPYKGQTTLGWRLGSGAKAGYWYGYDDWNHGKEGLGTIMVPDVVHSDTGFLRAVEDDCGEGSACLHVRFLGGTGYAYPFAGVGFNFLGEGDDVDLSTMDSITFRAKGKGSFRFKLMTRHITDDFDRKNYWADMGTTYRLSATWKNFTMKVSDIRPQDGAPLADTATWQECMDHTRKIHLATSPTFKARDTLDLWIDDLVMHGVVPAVFGGSWIEGPSTGVGKPPVPRETLVSLRGSRLEWDPFVVKSLRVSDVRGSVVVPTEVRRGWIGSADLPRGSLLVRAVLGSGETTVTRFVNLP